MTITCATGPSGWIFTSSSEPSPWSCEAGGRINTVRKRPAPGLIFRWLPVILWAGFIFFLSSYSNPLQSPVVVEMQAEVNSIDIPNVSIRPMLPKISLTDLAAIVNHSELTRRIFHLLLYMTLGYLVYRALILSAGQYSIWAAWGASALYGLSDEFHQHFVPGRTFQWLDIVFDIIGALIGILLYDWIVRRRRAAELIVKPARTS